MDGFLKDVTHAFRSLRNNPGFTFAAVAALALGIGANAAIFSVINTVLLSPMEVPDADRMVWFSARGEQGNNRSGSPAKFQHWRQQTSVVEDVAATRPGGWGHSGGLPLRRSLSDFGTRPQVWTPFQLDPNTSDQGHYFQVMGRLKDGVSLAQARAALEQSTQAYRTRFPDVMAEAVFDVDPVRDVLVNNARSSLLVLLEAVGFVLLIACANVANLLLVRATGQRREIALRAALGAGRGRIIRQLLTESVMLSLAGGGLGLLLAVAGIRALLAVNTAGLPRIGEEGAQVSLDWRVALFALVVSVATGLVFGLLPALRSSRADLSSALKEGGSRSGSGFGQNKVRALLVVTRWRWPSFS